MIIATTAWIVVIQTFTSWYAKVQGVSHKRDHLLYIVLLMFSVTKMSKLLVILQYHMLDVPIKSLQLCVALLFIVLVYQGFCYRLTDHNVYALISVTLTIILLANCLYIMMYAV